MPEPGLMAAETPRILAIADVRLSAPATVASEVTSFYTELIGLEPLPRESRERRLAFYGFPRSGPRLYVDLLDEPAEPSNKRDLLVQIASLFHCEQRLIERGLAYEWSHGWWFFDRRLCLPDPAGNRIELVAYHAL